MQETALALPPAEADGPTLCVEIHEVHWENKWMGSSDLDGLNKTTSRTAGRGLNEKQYDNKEVKLINTAKQVNTG